LELQIDLAKADWLCPSLILCSSELQGEKELLDALAEKEPTFAEVNHLLAE
jgi:hypothetical protein